MDIDELLKLNNVYTDGLMSATNQAFEPQGALSPRPQYMDIEQMVNSVMRKHQQDIKSKDNTVDNTETVLDAEYTNGFRAIL